MATWNPENVVITEKGNQVLSKVQMGIGAINVTRIMTGGESVPYADLSTLESIPNEKQECSILRYRTDTQGSVTELSISNETIQEAYSLYTIGVYVTHPDFEGEILYMVAECDISNPDLIPLPTVTVATMYYDLYVKHSNTSNIVIQVDPNGVVTKDIIGTPGGVPGLDSTGHIPIEQIPNITEDLLPDIPIGKLPEVLQNMKAPVWCVTTSAADEVNKVVSVSDFTLAVGASLLLYVSTKNTAYNPAIQINNTYSVNVADKNGKILQVADAGILDGLCLLVYDGTYFILLNSLGNSSTIGSVMLSDSFNSQSPASSGVAATPYAVKSAYDVASGKANKVSYTTTISADSWVDDGEDGFTVSITIAGIKATDTPVIGCVQTGTRDTDNAILKSWGYVSRIVTNNNSITCYAYSTKPEVNIPLQIMCIR